MQREEIRTRVNALLSQMNRGAFEREEVISLSLLSAFAGESIFLLGLPGVGKSMVARRLKMAFKESTCFEYLMSRFSTPDEIFGPVSINKLKDEDTYERVVDGYLPTADVVFLDEIWKAGPAIQNSLLTAINEKIFHNGDHDLYLPTKGIIAASNELPAEGEGLEALWDRFLIRYVVQPIRRDSSFIELIRGNAPECIISENLQFTIDEYKEIQSLRKSIVIPNEIMDIIITLRTLYNEMKRKYDEDEVDEEAKDTPPPYISDRRWKKIAGILRTSALLNGRDCVDLSDCLLLEHLIWDNDRQISDICKDVSQLIGKSVVQVVTGQRKNQIASGNEENKLLYSPDGGSHYVIESGEGQLMISVADYDKLSAASKYGRFSDDGGIELCSGKGDFMIRTTKPGTVTINYFTYPLKTVPKNEKSESLIAMSRPEEIMMKFQSSVERNIFLRPLKEYPILDEGIRKVLSSSKKTHFAK